MNGTFANTMPMTPVEFQTYILLRRTANLAHDVRMNGHNILDSWSWSRRRTNAFIQKHYWRPNDARKMAIHDALKGIAGFPNPNFPEGPVACLLRSYGHGLDRSMADVPNQYLKEHLVKAHQMICLDNGIGIGFELFRAIVVDAAQEVFPARNWNEVSE